jgi:hypothetical protein
LATAFTHTNNWTIQNNPFHTSFSGWCMDAYTI